MANESFDVIIVGLKWQDENIRREAERCYEALTNAGLDCLLDDREETAGTKFNKAVPHRWKSELTDEESAEFKTQFSDFYRRLWLRRLSWRSRPLANAARKVFG